jgi:hypothetical protein
MRAVKKLRAVALIRQEVQAEVWAVAGVVRLLEQIKTTSISTP